MIGLRSISEKKVNKIRHSSPTTTPPRFSSPPHPPPSGLQGTLASESPERERDCVVYWYSIPSVSTYLSLSLVCVAGVSIVILCSQPVLFLQTAPPL
jgi:hypothetical protein